MRDQYAGDISDFFKFAFLRAVVPEDAFLGIAWFYVMNHDGRADGRHTEYWSEKLWRDLDKDLFDALSGLENRSVEALEALPIWHVKTKFHRVPITPIEGRDLWAKKMLDDLSDSSIIFADPDNGVSPDKEITERHARLSEIKNLASLGRPLVFIRFPHRKKNHTHARQLEDLHRLLKEFSPATLTTSVSIPTKSGGKAPRFRWFTVLNGDDKIRSRASAFGERLNSFKDAKAQFIMD